MKLLRLDGTKIHEGKYSTTKELVEYCAKNNISMERINLEDKDLDGVNFEGANLEYAIIEYSNFKFANLKNVNLAYSNIKNSDFEGSNLENTNFEGANIYNSNLKHANLNGANMNFSIINLSCKDLDIHLDDKLLIQRLYHILRNAKFSRNASKEVKNTLLTKELLDLANKFHMVDEFGIFENRQKVNKL